MKHIDLYQSLGYVLELLAISDYHGKFEQQRYLWTEIMPPLQLGQMKIYRAENGAPTALVTWAWLSEAVETEVHSTGRALSQQEWQSGERLLFNDFIAPYGRVREISHDLTRNLFSDQVASSIDRYPDRSIRKINRWTGANYRKGLHKQQANPLQRARG